MVGSRHIHALWAIELQEWHLGERDDVLLHLLRLVVCLEAATRCGVSVSDTRREKLTPPKSDT